MKKILDDANLKQVSLGTDLKIKDDIRTALILLKCFAIPDTRAANIIDMMLKHCSSNHDIGYDVSDSVGKLDEHSVKLSNIIFEYAAMGNIPLALSAISPCFLLNKAKYSAQFIKSIRDFINSCAKDQSLSSINKMEKAFLITSDLLYNIAKPRIW